MTVIPDFNTATFNPGASIDNPYYPLESGTISVYEGEPVDEDIGEVMEETIRTAVTFETKEVAGVTARVVRDTAWADGFLQEDTQDWFAQDTDGNVWYLGESTIVRQLLITPNKLKLFLCKFFPLITLTMRMTMMLRKQNVSIALLAAIASIAGIFGTVIPVLWAAEFSEAELFFELNDTDGDGSVLDLWI